MNRFFASRLAPYPLAVNLVLTLTPCLSGAAAASSIPAGWTCTGSCGSSRADGVVPLSPLGTSAYQWISTNGGIAGVGALAGVGGSGHPTNGSNKHFFGGGKLAEFLF